MENIESLKFVYGEEAAIVNVRNENYLVISDLHIGIEEKLIKKNIKLYNSAELMTERIIKILKEFEINNIIILGDIKESILRPSNTEKAEIKKFFYRLKDYNITIISGNHDIYLEEITQTKIIDELIIDKIAFIHGHKMPSNEAMLADMILAGHNHISIELVDEHDNRYTQKAWIMAKLNVDKAREKYNIFNKSIKLIIFPAFNNLITGMPINKIKDERLFVGRLFNYKTAKVYSINGDYLGIVSRLKLKDKQKF
ncbi:MAG: metallophosphoesterase family protein [Candidatus Marsarchaeota archaeon]|jgi:putative SbcD/Mre11-related phosphoesterase|nr:metallophosphoesterase family protein [Candidatus Marsarchaeota archaeon]